MSLTCGDWGGDYDWWYFSPDDFETLQTKRGRRCCSCKEPIKPGATVARFLCQRNPKSLVEERIYGECGEVPMAPKFMCERCGGLYFAIEERGYNIALGDDMRELAREANEYDLEAARARAPTARVVASSNDGEEGHRAKAEEAKGTVGAASAAAAGCPAVASGRHDDGHAHAGRGV